MTPNLYCQYYLNLSLDQYSSYRLYNRCVVKRFNVLDPDVNFTDHLPIIADITTCTRIDSKSVCYSSHSWALEQCNCDGTNVTEWLTTSINVIIWRH